MMFISADMLLSHYNWKSVSERGANLHSQEQGRGENFGISSDIDCIDYDSGSDADEHVENVGDGDMRGIKRIAETSYGTGNGALNMAYDNSICRLYILLHNVEDIFPLLTESSAAGCPNSEHHIGTLQETSVVYFDDLISNLYE